MDIKERIEQWACDHDIGKIEVDGKGRSYSHCPKCNKKLHLNKTTLEDIDTMAIEEIDNLLPNGQTVSSVADMSIKKYSKMRRMECSKCSGKLFEVEPVVKMDDKTLYECERCQEREYKITS